MSGFGAGGFAQGFLQGFETMGQQFARRGILRDATATQAREDKRLALEEALRTAADKRAETALKSETDLRDLQMEEARDRMKYFGPQTEAQIANTTASAEHTKALTQQVGPTANANIEATRAGTDLTKKKGETYQRAFDAEQEVQAELLKQNKIKTQAGELELQAAQRKNATVIKASDAINNIRSGKYTPNDVAAIYPMLSTLTNERFEDDAQAIFGAVQTAAKNRGNVEAFNQPQVLESLNRTVGGAVNQSRGMPLTQDGGMVVRDSKITQMIMHPDGDKIGFEVMVQPEPSPERKAQIQAAMANATPAQKRELEAELNPQPYTTALTENRTPTAQGGKMRWFTQPEVQKLVMGIQGMGELRAANPALIEELKALKVQLDAGVLPNGGTDKDELDMRIKARRENRDTAEAGRKARDDAFKEASAMIDKEFGQQSPLTGLFEIPSDKAPRATEEKVMVDTVLRENPRLTGPQALAEARRRLPQAATPAPVTDKAGKGRVAPARAGELLKQFGIE